ncbi:uncharacterized protein K444DRAFT_649082 [Hyaloscypha bicolor E]|uniref:Uncharacterized protein n=1 Tax=Hyaloscypha bicolor E TaxID=1095630 RepID=A0A2J6SEF5_9HELO|nr:uncharacterized protein K444DRAFT_649082 [Hyaloscypha bicolor E]PMD49147.1 hypothetical protein K444DRAFT_649082 [Hyaloscypha bicolor E]
MEAPSQKRDINELLTTGYFKTTRGKSPSGAPTSSNAHSFLAASHDAPRQRSQSRNRSPRRRLPPPPQPFVEDELKSLARESSASIIPSYDPPLRGIIEQNPIILEAGVTKDEAARLQTQPCPVEKDTNPERRFVLIPKSDTYSPNEAEEDEPMRREREKPPRQEERRDTGRPPIERRRSRQDLPSLETKIPREIPPQYRRSTSAYASSPRDNDRIPQPSPFRKSESLLLSPEIARGSKDYFGQPLSRHDSHGARTPTHVADKRASGGSYSARPVTPTSEKRPHGESGTRSRRNTGEKMTRPQQLSAEFSDKRSERQHSPNSARSSRSSNQSARRYYSSSEDDIADSGSDRERRRRGDTGNGHDRRRRSPSRSNRSSIEVKPLSVTSPLLPSPKVSPSQIQRGDPFERSEIFPRDPRNRRKDQNDSRDVSPFSPAEDAPRADRLNPIDPRPSKSRQPSAGPSTKAPAPPPHLVPIPIPSNIGLQSPGDTRKTPTYASFDDKTPAASMPPPTAPYWQPPPFQPGNLEKPVGSYRRFSEDIERGSVAPLPSCPRIAPSQGRTDWLTLPHCPRFDICPSCFNSIIAPTEFRHLFIPSPRRSPDTEVLCDFGSSPWYRIAWLLTLKEKRRDLKLFYGLADIATKVQPCLGKHEAVRQWHSIIDPKTRAPVPGFSVCYSCVKSVETLLPALRKIFVQVDSHRSTTGPRVCSLRFDSKRFIEYFDALETTADRADYDDRDPDMRDVASLARRMASMPECQHDKELIDRKWHIITQLPEFTVCEECFDDVVEPELEERKAIPLLFKQTLQRIPKASCQLYSTKMRGIFRLAVDSDDYKLLAAKARERKTLELAYKANVAELRRSRGGPIIENEMRRIAEEWKKWE